MGSGADRARRRRRGAPDRRLPRRQRHDPPQGAGRADGRQADRGGPRDGRGQHADQGGSQARRPQHRRARVQGRARLAGRPPEDAADGDRAGRRRRGARRRLRPHPRGVPAGDRVQPPPPPRGGAGQALRAQRGAHGAAGDAVARVDHRGRAGQDQDPGQRDVDRADGRRIAGPGRDPPPGAARARPDLLEDQAAARRRGCGLRHGGRRSDAAPPGRGGVQPVDGPARAARGHGRGAGRCPGARAFGRPRASRRRTLRAPTRRPSPRRADRHPRRHGALPVHHVRREPRADAGRRRRGRARRPRAHRGRPRRRPRPSPARLRSRRAPGHRARPGADPGRRPARAHARLADPARGREPRLGELDPRDAGRAAERRRGGRARRARRRRQPSAPSRSPASGRGTRTSPAR